MHKFILGTLLVVMLSACGAPNSIPAPAVASPTASGVNVPPMTVVLNPNEEATLPSVATPEGDEDYGDVNCTHTFYPVTDGATWTYALSDGGNTTHTMSVDAFGNFTIHVASAQMTATIQGQCTPEGIILMESPGDATTVNSESGDASVVATNVSGVTLPMDVKEGQQWSQVIEANTQMGKSTIETNYTAVGFENITVPAGTFYALKIEQSGYVTISSYKVAMHGFNWYVEGVGVVMSAMDGASSVELTSYDIPD